MNAINALDVLSRAVPTIIALVVAVIGGFGFRQFQLNSAAELRLKKSAEAERDIALSRLIVDLTLQAGGNAGFVISDRVTDAVLNVDQVKNALQSGHMSSVNDLIALAAFIPTPVSLPSRRVAIEAVVDLGERYESLTDRVRAGLEIIQKEALPTELRHDVDSGIVRLDKIKPPAPRSEAQVKIYHFVNHESCGPIVFTVHLDHTPAQLTSAKLDEPFGIPQNMRTRKARFIFSARVGDFLATDQSYGHYDIRNGDVFVITDEPDKDLMQLLARSLSERAE